MRFAAAVILYNPKKIDIARVSEYIKSFDIVYLYDNSLDNSSYYNELPLDRDNVIYNYNNKNDGLPVAYNTILNYLANEKIDYICTLDQDSEFSYEDICNMKEYIEHGADDKIAIYAPLVQYAHRKDYEIKKEEIKLCKWVITSGAFINLEILKKHEIKYDTNYFIDKFEIDLCKQLTNLGYKIVMYNRAILRQTLGEINKQGYSEHSVLRHYYLFRNRFYFNKKFYGIPKRWSLNVLQTIRHFWEIIVREGEKGKKLGAFFEATKDYCVGKMGARE